MARYIPLDVVVAEIKRRISAIDNCFKLTGTQIAVLEGNKVVLTKLLSFLNTLETKEVQEEPVSKDMEEAAVEAFKQIVDSDKNSFLEIFKAGAKWQKEQMMAKAIDGEVGYWNQRGLSILMKLPRELDDEDKCKVIIIKSE